jgi:hypothetical protein
MTLEEVFMGSTAIIAAIDKEIARLRKQRSVVIKKQEAAKKKAHVPGRSGAAKKSGKRRLSPAGRARIAEAQRKRWASAKKGNKGSR